MHGCYRRSAKRKKKKEEERELWNVLDCAGMVGNKRGKKEKTKEKSMGTWVEEKKRGGKKKKKRREGEPTCVCGEKKNYITIFLQ